jgi:putative copper export protein
VRTVADVKERARLMRLITTRFGYLAWGAMVVLIITGIGNVFEQNDRTFLFDHNWGVIFQLKMTLVILTILLTAAHSFVIGPRMLAAQESVVDQAQIASMRRFSIMISAVNALLAVGILFCAALLNTDFALR